MGHQVFIHHPTKRNHSTQRVGGECGWSFVYHVTYFLIHAGISLALKRANKYMYLQKQCELSIAKLIIEVHPALCF